MEEPAPVTTRRRLRALALINVALVAVLAVAMATRTPPGGRPSPAPASAAPRPAPALSDPTPRIAIVYEVGGRGTAGFNELAWEGAKRAADAFSAELTEVSAGPGDTDADREARLRKLAEARYDPIFVIGSTYAGAVARVAPGYPSTWFGMLDDGTVDGRNVIGIQFNEEQGSYLVGAAAALTSKTGIVGFVGAVRSPLLQKYEAGFAAGARAADRRVKVRVSYVSRDSAEAGLGDPAGARKAALRMFDAGADVLFAAVGDATSVVIQAAHDRGRWAIGANTDHYLSADPSVRGAILTSMLKRADVGTYTITMEVANGVPKDGNNVLGVDRGGGGYATSGGFVDPIRAQLDAFAARIAAGEILVPTTP
jgi:basic membrane protein A